MHEDTDYEDSIRSLTRAIAQDLRDAVEVLDNDDAPEWERRHFLEVVLQAAAELEQLV